MTAIPGTVVAALISPGDTAATFPTHAAAYGRGGWRSVADLTALAAVPTDRLESGCVAWVIALAVLYQWNGSAWAPWYPGTGAAAPRYSAENKEGSTISAGQVVATHSSGVGVVLASAADGTKPAVGLMVADTADTIAGDVQTDGLLTLPDWSAVVGSTTLSRGPYFLDPSTPGQLTQTAPTTLGQIVQPVGYGVGPADFDLSPGNPILL